MGSMISKLSGQTNSKTVRSRKRKYVEDDDSDGEDVPAYSKRIKTKKNLLSTPQYIFKRLFKEGADSDIKLQALGKIWNLHKIYLCQSPYFASMFSGSWKEATENEINIEIVDPNVTTYALDTVLGSLYFSELTLESTKLVSVLAAASLFQLDSVAEKCAEVMKETLNIENVLEFYRAGIEYGITTVEHDAFEWLEANLLTCVKDYPDVLSSISIPLMTKLVASPGLFVVQTECSLYYLLQMWLFYQLDPNHKTVSGKQVLEQCFIYFQNFPDQRVFLDTEQGIPYREPFRYLRYQHFVNIYEDVKRLKDDRIVPDRWIKNVTYTCWTTLLRINQSLDRGPKECTLEEISKNGFRCGRILSEDKDHIWRWTGFIYGLDLVWSLETGVDRMIRVRRNHRTNDLMLSMLSKRYLLCRVTVVKLNDQRQICYREKSEVINLGFSRHEEVNVTTIKKDIKFPVYFLAEFLVTNHESSRCEIGL